MNNSRFKGIVAVIWTINPSIQCFRRALSILTRQVDYIVIVDNNSENQNLIGDLIKDLNQDYKKLTFIKMRYNSGVRALNIGIRYALEKFDPQYIVLLDADTSLCEGIIKLVISYWRKLKKIIPNIGVIGLTKGHWFRNLRFVKVRIFSGSIIDKRVLASGIKIREEFFLDQADFDFFHEIRRAGYEVLQFDGGIKEHELGVKIKFGGHILKYEPLHRYYYIVRNSTVLLLERKLPLFFYIRQLIIWGFPLIFVKGVKQTMRALIMGLTDGIFKRLGYLDPKFLES